jgi:Uma2 family endonuclease
LRRLAGAAFFAFGYTGIKEPIHAAPGARNEVMATRTLLTFQEFEKYRDDNQKHELLQGEHIILPPPKSDHSDIQHMLLRVLQPYVDQHGLGDVRIEAGFKLSDGHMGAAGR